MNQNNNNNRDDIYAVDREQRVREILNQTEDEKKAGKTVTEADVREIIRKWEEQRDTPAKLARSMPLELKITIKAFMNGLRKISNRQNQYQDERLKTAIFIEQLCGATDIMSTLLEQLADISQDQELRNIAQGMSEALNTRSRNIMDWVMRQPHIAIPPHAVNANHNPIP